MRSLFVGIGAVLAWIALELAGDVVGELLGYLSRPVTRPIWRAIVRARSPWPLVAMLASGIGAASAGLQFKAADDWRAGLGILLFLGGSGLAVIAPLVWRDAKREAAQIGQSESRPVV